MSYFSLSPKSKSFIQSIQLRNDNRSMLVSMVIAKILIDKTPFIETDADSKVRLLNPEEPNAYYKHIHLPIIKQKLGKINEHIVINNLTILEFCEKFYLMRQRMTESKTAMSAMKGDDAVLHFFNVEHYFSKHMCEELNKNVPLTTSTYNGFLSILEDISND